MKDIFGFRIKKSILSTLNCNTRTHIFHNFSSMSKVLIFFSYEDWKEIEPIVQDLEKEGKELILWTILPRKQKEIQGGLPRFVRAITPKEISRIRGLSPSIVEEFKSLKYDTLFDFTTDEDNLVLCLLACNSAEFCIGIKEIEYKIYDFIVLKDENINLLETYEQIKIYQSKIL